LLEKAGEDHYIACWLNEGTGIGKNQLGGKK
jgi:hypothetical protein